MYFDEGWPDEIHIAIGIGFQAYIVNRGLLA